MAAIDTTVPANDAAEITKHDTAILTRVPVGIYVGVTGDVKVTMQAGGVVTFVGLAAGVIHPIRPKLVWSTGTTATGIVAVYSNTETQPA